MPLYSHAPYDEDLRKQALSSDVQHSRLIYLDLEEELENFCRFVPPVADHLSVYSTKLWGLLLRASAEIDSQLHSLVEELDKKRVKTRIDDYRARENIFELSKFKLISRFDGQPVVPFESFASNKSPDWWHDYNAVKHRRLESLRNATLGNTILAVGGLYVVLYRQWGEYLLPRVVTLVNGQHVAQSPSKILFDRCVSMDVGVQLNFSFKLTSLQPTV